VYPLYIYKYILSICNVYVLRKNIFRSISKNMNFLLRILCNISRKIFRHFSWKMNQWNQFSALLIENMLQCNYY